MFHHKERPLREQLIEARERIAIQLRNMQSPADAGGASGPPDFCNQIAELEDQLREIDDLLRPEGENNA